MSLLQEITAAFCEGAAQANRDRGIPEASCREGTLFPTKEGTAMLVSASGRNTVLAEVALVDLQAGPLLPHETLSLERWRELQTLLRERWGIGYRPEVAGGLTSDRERGFWFEDDDPRLIKTLSPVREIAGVRFVDNGEEDIIILYHDDDGSLQGCRIVMDSRTKGPGKWVNTVTLYGPDGNEIFPAPSYVRVKGNFENSNV